MSLAFMAVAWTSGTPPSDRLVLLALADWANPHGECWPSIPRLADKTGLNERTVRLAIGRLDGIHLAREHRVGRGTTYRLMGGSPGETPTPGVSPTPDIEPAPGVPPATPGVTPTNTSMTRQLKKKASPSPSGKGALFASLAAGIDLPALPASASLDQWADFAAMRVEMTRGSKPKPWTFGAAKKARETLIALATAGHDAGRSLDASVLNGWQGLFKPKDDQDGQRGFQLGRGGAARADRGRPLDGFTAALRHVTARGGADDAGGG